MGHALAELKVGAGKGLDVLGVLGVGRRGTSQLNVLLGLGLVLELRHLAAGQTGARRVVGRQGGDGAAGCGLVPGGGLQPGEVVGSQDLGERPPRGPGLVSGGAWGRLVKACPSGVWARASTRTASIAPHALVGASVCGGPEGTAEAAEVGSDEHPAKPRAVREKD